MPLALKDNPLPIALTDACCNLAWLTIVIISDSFAGKKHLVIFVTYLPFSFVSTLSPSWELHMPIEEVSTASTVNKTIDKYHI